jgi:ribonuclease P protein component
VPGFETICLRADFVAASKALRTGRPGLMMQMRLRGDDGPARFGFTASRKVGGAVIRNRAKRRMRAIARELSATIPPHIDCVMIARPETASIDFAQLRAEANSAFEQLKKRLMRTLPAPTGTGEAAATQSKGDGRAKR